MTKNSISRLLIVSACVAALAAQMPVMAPAKARGALQADAADEARRRVSISPVLVLDSGAVITPAGSQLVRARDGVFMTLHTQDLPAGIVATAWWVFFNHPAACATSPCGVPDLFNPAVEASIVNAAGRIVGADGAASYGAFRAVGDTTGALFGPGLLDPKKAEIFLVVRSHGPALLGDPAALAQQLTMYNGGCPPNTCTDLQISIHQP